MSDDHSSQEKTEEATSKRLEDAHKKGQVPRSRELNTLASLLVAGVALLVLGPAMVDSLKTMLVHSLAFDQARAYDIHAMGVELGASVRDMLLLMAPMLLLMAAVSLVSPIALGGFLFSGDNLLPKYERIDPIKGLARIFSMKSVLELLKAIAKVVLVGLMVYFIGRLVFHDLILLPFH